MPCYFFRGFEGWFALYFCECFVFELGDDVHIFSTRDYWDISIEASPSYDHVDVGIGVFIITSARSCFDQYVVVLDRSPSLFFFVGLFRRSDTLVS